MEQENLWDFYFAAFAPVLAYLSVPGTFSSPPASSLLVVVVFSHLVAAVASSLHRPVWLQQIRPILSAVVSSVVVVVVAGCC